MRAQCQNQLNQVKRNVFALKCITQFASKEIKNTATLVMQSVMATWNMKLVFAKLMESAQM